MWPRRNNLWFLVFGVFVTGGRSAETVEQQNSPRLDHLPIEIEGGAFVRSGSPVYLMGPWFTGVRPPAGPEAGHRVYTVPLDRGLLQEFGCNTAAPLGAFSFLPTQEVASGAMDQALAEQLLPALEPLRRVPLVVALAGTPRPPKARSHSAPAMLRQADEDGLDDQEMADEVTPAPVMTDGVRDGIAARVRLFAAAGGNPRIYCRVADLLCGFPADLDQAETLRRWFARRYRKVGVANTAWGTSFGSFSDAVTALHGVPGGQRGPLYDCRIFRSLLASRLQRAFREVIEQADARASRIHTAWWSTESIQPDAPLGFAAAYSRSDVVCVNSQGLLGGTEGSRLRATAALAVARACASGKSPRVVLDIGFGSSSPGTREGPLRPGEVEACLWTGVFMGAGGSLLCNWDGPLPQLSPSAAPPGLPGHGAGSLFLDPKRCPLVVLSGLRRFRTEVDRLRSIVLPRQADPAEAAVLLPEDLHGVDGRGDDDGLAGVLAVFDALRRLRIPVDFVLGSQVGGPTDLRSYRVVFAPGLARCSSELGRNLGGYVRSGGVLVVGPGAMAADEYGRSTPAVLFLGLRFSPSPDFAPDSLVLASGGAEAHIQGRFTPVSSALPGDADPVALWAGAKTPAAFRKQEQVGTGHTYTLLFHATGADMASFLDVLLKREGVRGTFDFHAVPEGASVEGVTVDRIERDRQRVYLLVNWGASPVFGKLTVTDVRAGRWHVVDAVEWQAMLSPTGFREWRASELSAGIEILLPPRERVLVLLSPAAVPGMMDEVSQESMRSRARAVLARGPVLDAEARDPAPLEDDKPSGGAPKQTAADGVGAKGDATDGPGAAKSAEAAAEAAETGPEKGKAAPPPAAAPPIRRIAVDSRFTYTVDLRPHVNRSFRDRTAGDESGGWTDEGPRRDMRELPLGVQTFGGVPYDVIDPDDNGEASCVVLAGDEKRGVPDRVEDIWVGRLAAELLFLHAAAAAKPATPFMYRVRYRDGNVLDVPVTVGRTTGVWHDVQSRLPDTDESSVAYASEGGRGSSGLFTYRWRNPRPSVPVRTLDIVTKGSGQALVVAVSGATPGLAEVEEAAPAYRVLSGAMVKPGWRLVPERGARMDTEVGEDGQLEVGVTSARGGRLRLRIEAERGAPSLEVPGPDWQLQLGLRFVQEGRDAVSFRPEIRIGLRREGRGPAVNRKAEVEQGTDLAMWQTVAFAVGGPVTVGGVRIELRGVPAGATCWMRNIWFVPSR